MDVWGRKKILSVCQILAGVSCMAAGCSGSLPWLQVGTPETNITWLLLFLLNKILIIDSLQIALSLIGKFGTTACFAIVFVYTAEMFPTEIRSSAVGSSSTCARIGGMLAPVVSCTNKRSSYHQLRKKW